MTTQTVQLSKVYENFTNNAPAPVFETIVKARGDVIASFNPGSLFSFSILILYLEPKLTNCSCRCYYQSRS
jgi:hypothetical protein